MARTILFPAFAVLLCVAFAQPSETGPLRSDAKCTAISPGTTPALPIIGLSTTESGAQCFTMRLKRSTRPGEAAQRISLNFTGLQHRNPDGHELHFAMWNHKRVTSEVGKTTVRFAAPPPPGGTTAQGVAHVDSEGRIEYIEITNHGFGYDDSPSCTIDANNAGYTELAECWAYVRGGKVVEVRVVRPGKGYPPSAGKDYFRWPQATLVTETAPVSGGPATVERTSIMGSPARPGKDRTRCDCSDVTAAVCACVPSVLTGRATPPRSGRCQDDMYIEFEAGEEVEVAFAAFYVSTWWRRNDLSVIPLGKPIRVFEPLGVYANPSAYVVAADANATNPLLSYTKELRLTVETPLSANWYCSGAPGRDCSHRDGYLASITLDTSGLPLYHNQPLVIVDPPQRGIAAVHIDNGGSYTTAPAVTVTRKTVPTVGTVQILTGGSGYVRPPRVVFAGKSGGTAPTGTASIVNGVVTAITVDSQGDGFGDSPVSLVSEMEVSAISVANPGSGFSSAHPPPVYISPPASNRDSRQARATAAVDPKTGRLVSITVTDPGYGYEEEPTVSVGYRVYGVNITHAGSNYTTAPNVTFTRTGGSCQGAATEIATATATISDGAVTSVTVDQANFQVCSGGSISVTFTASDGGGSTATGAVLTTPGSGADVRVHTRWLHSTTAMALAYPSQGFAQRDAILRAVLGEGCNPKVVRVDVIDPGTGYGPDDIITFSTGDANATFTLTPAGTQATATASIDSYKLVDSVTVRQGGSGYSTSSPPAVQIVPAPRVRLIKVTNPGSGYTAPPLVYVEGPANSRARATATVENGRLTAITVTDPGAWYLSSTSRTVHITPRFEIREIELTSRGSGYDPANPPRVWISVNAGMSQTSGTGATAVAEVSPSGCLSAIRITNSGSGYMDGSTSVIIEAPPVAGGVTATATVIIGGGSGAQAVAELESGQDAEAEAIVDASGAVSGITVTRKGFTFGEGGYDLPAITTSPLTYGLSYTMELNDAGLPTGRVHITGTASNGHSSPPTVNLNPSYGMTGRATLGSANVINLFEGPVPSQFPASITYTPAVQTYSYYDLDPSSNLDSYLNLRLRGPSGADYMHFPDEDFASNNAFGADNPLNALMVPATITVEAIPYPELYQKGAVTGTVKAGDTTIFQISVPRGWSRVKLNYTTSTPGNTLSFQTKWIHSEYGAGSTSCYTGWCSAIANNAENAIYRRRHSQQELHRSPNERQAPLLVQVRAGQCIGSEVNFKLEAEVTEYDTEGECSASFDCQAGPGRAHPTPRSRVALSANGNQERFRRCYTDPRPGLLHTGICLECMSDCDCHLGQYCHTDTEPEADGTNKYGTCQRKDPVGDILGKPCRAISPSSMVEYGQAGRNTQQFCGKVLFYNDSHIDPTAVNNRRGEARRTLWSGSCINHVCYECASEGSTTCNRRICVDGFWQEKSGNSLQGAHAAAQTSAIKNAVSDGNAISGGVLAFLILIALAVGFAVFFTVRRRTSAGAGGAKPAVELSREASPQQV